MKENKKEHDFNTLSINEELKIGKDSSSEGMSFTSNAKVLTTPSKNFKNQLEPSHGFTTERVANGNTIENDTSRRMVQDKLIDAEKQEINPLDLPSRNHSGQEPSQRESSGPEELVILKH